MVLGCAHTEGSTGSSVVAMTPPPRIDFVENDYLHALSVARKEHKPLFVDAWAPWCHTCLSMKSYVFDQPEIRAQAKDFVWLSMDTETTPGQEFVQKFPMKFWPTLWVLDAKAETPELKWEAAATAPELARLLHAVSAEHGDGHAGEAGSAGLAESARIRGERATARADLPVAIAAFREALAASAGIPGGWPERAQTAEALAVALYEANERTACVELADAEYDKLPPGTSRTNVALFGFRCAEPMAATVPARRIEQRFELLLGIARDRRIPLLPDDRSDIYNTLVEHLQEEKTPAAEGRARTLAGEWAAFVDNEAATAKTPAARAVFDSHRLLADLAMDQPARAIPMLEQSEKDFPEDYNPPARLARAQLALKTAEGRRAALASIDRALGLVYGPRKLSLVLVKCDVLDALRDAHEANEQESVASETHLLEAALAGEEASRGKPPSTVRKLRERLDALTAKRPKSD